MQITHLQTSPYRMTSPLTLESRSYFQWPNVLGCVYKYLQVVITRPFTPTWTISPSFYLPLLCSTKERRVFCLCDWPSSQSPYRAAFFTAVPQLICAWLGYFHNATDGGRLFLFPRSRELVGWFTKFERLSIDLKNLLMKIQCHRPRGHRWCHRPG